MKNNPQAQEVTRIGMIRKSPVRYFIRPRILSDGFYSPLVRLLPLICIFRVVLVLYLSCWIGMHVQIDLSPQASEAWLCKSLCLEHPSGIGLVFSASETWELCCCALLSPPFCNQIAKNSPELWSLPEISLFSGAFLRLFFFFSPDSTRNACRNIQFLENTSPQCCWVLDSDWTQGIYGSGPKCKSFPPQESLHGRGLLGKMRFPWNSEQNVVL